MGSILLYLNDGDKTVKELQDILNIKNDKEFTKFLEILVINNIIVYYVKDNTTYHKYVEPYGNVICDNILIPSVKNELPKIVNFTDNILTMDSRIMKETKVAKQIHIMELERKVQEFMGDEYIRTVFYQRLESLISRYYIENVNNMIIYL